ncbi:hypothetical protein [Rhodococcus ruber]|uniref:hypothetical protein n=1 Tax=Rhodococcus ruber TaxID=1830 RepID=UPI0037841320
MTPECEVCGRPSADSIAYCYRCADSFRSELMHVPSLVSDLDIARDRLDRLTRPQPGGKSSETGLPIRLDRKGRPADFRRLLERLAHTIGTWAALVAEEAGLAFDLREAPRGLEQLVLNNRAGHSHRHDPAELIVHPIRDVELAAVWLAHQPRALRGVPTVVDMHDEVTDAVADVRRAVDHLPVRVYKGTCPYRWTDWDGEIHVCGADLYVEKGEDWIRCPRCGVMHEIRHLERDVLGELEDRVYTLAELLGLMRELGEPVPKATLYAWANDRRRRKLDPRGWRRPDGTVTDTWIDRRDSAVYRLGDVRALRRATLAEASET